MLESVKVYELTDFIKYEGDDFDYVPFDGDVH